MTVTKNQNPAPVLYENKIAMSLFLSNLQSAENTINALAQNWNQLEVGQFDLECLEKIHNTQFFKDRYSKLVWEKLNKVDLPKPLKLKLFAESESSDEYKSLLVRLDGIYNSASRWSRVALNGGVRSFDVRMEFFEIIEGKVSLVSNIEEVVSGQFRIIGDNPEKVKVFEKLSETAKCLTELTELLEKTGLYKAYYNPVIEQSPFFYFENNSYKPRPEILI